MVRGQGIIGGWVQKFEEVSVSHIELGLRMSVCNVRIQSDVVEVSGSTRSNNLGRYHNRACPGQLVNTATLSHHRRTSAPTTALAVHLLLPLSTVQPWRILYMVQLFTLSIRLLFESPLVLMVMSGFYSDSSSTTPPVHPDPLPSLIHPSENVII